MPDPLEPYPHGRSRVPGHLAPVPRHETTGMKAERLIRENNVYAYHDPVRLFVVTGDTDTYRVMLGPGVRYCPCKSPSTDCSHIQAAILYAKRHGGELLAYEMGLDRSLIPR